MTLPMAPNNHWLFGHLGPIRKNAVEWAFELAKDFDGKPGRFRMLNVEGYFFLTPEAVKDMMVSRQKDFEKETVAWRMLRSVFGYGILTSDGDLWARQRRQAVPAFQAGCMRSYARTIAERAESSVNQWSEGKLEVIESTGHFALDVAIDCLMGGSSPELRKVVRTNMISIQAHLTHLILGIPYPVWVPTPGNLRYKRELREMHDAIDQMVAERRANPTENDDLLDMMIQGADQLPEEEGKTYLRDNLISFLIAGHETSAYGLLWTLYQLARHPEIQKRCRDEALAAKDIREMPYCEAAIKETLRMFPPVYSLERVAMKDSEIDGIKVPKGKYCFVSIYALHHSEKYWDRPMEFRPERFIEDPNPSAFVAFNRGGHACIGREFAMIEMKAFLREALRKFKWSYPEDQPLGTRPLIGLTPDRPLTLWLERLTEQDLEAGRQTEDEEAPLYSATEAPSPRGSATPQTTPVSG